MNQPSPSIQQLAELVGFHENYINSFGELKPPNIDALKSLLTIMGYDLSTEEVIMKQVCQLKDQKWQTAMPSTHVIKSINSVYSVPLSLDKAYSENVITFTIETENNELTKHNINLSTLTLINAVKVGDTSFNQYEVPIPKLPEGYHRLTLTLNQKQSTCHLIIAPSTCFSASEASKSKVWGYATQLYSVKSDSNFGMGDFGDLNNIIVNTANQGASTVGLNPLHSLYQNNPAHISPYSPISRCFLNTLYIDINAIDNFSTCEQAIKIFNSDDYQSELKKAKSDNLINYPLVAQLKYSILEVLFNDFTAPENASKNKSMMRKFLDFIDNQGEDLANLTTFEALFEHFRSSDDSIYDWRSWPKEYQSPTAEKVVEFKLKYKKRINYFMYLQWLAHTQLMNAAELTNQHNMPIGLYLDLAVGCDGSGVDVWSNQEVYVSGASIGAPPDAMNTLGQNWGLTPMNPVALKDQGYLPLIKALRSNMQYAGALRIDHILGLMRQYWVAPEMGADEGIYISFPLDDILSIIALESRRSSCVVIGEDLGTVPEGFTDTIAQSGLLSYKVLYFERWWDTGLFKRPESYSSQSIATVSTHDVPTLVGWWSSRDIEWRNKLNLYPNEELKAQDPKDRIADRQFLISALKDSGTLASNAINDNTFEISASVLNLAAQKYIGLSNSHIQLIPIEDGLELIEQVNIPGTIDEHPNWRQKLPLNLNEIWETPSIINIKQLMNEVRPNNHNVV